MSHSCVLIPPAACDATATSLAAPLLPTACRAGGKECSGAEPASAEGGGAHGEKRGMVLGVVVGSGIFATPGVVLIDSGGAPISASCSFLPSPPPPPNSAPHSLLSLSMVLGVVVGSGIFATPGVVLIDSGGAPISALIVWLCAGVVAYSCCEVYAELGSSIPHAGGDGEYIQLAFGDLLSFVFMWMFFFVSTGGGIAILIVTFARYTIALLPGMQGASEEQMEMGVRIIGCSFTLLLTAINCAGACFTVLSPSLLSSHPLPIIGCSFTLLLTAINCAGVKAGALVQNILTVTKALLIAAVVACAPIFISLHGTAVAATNLLPSSSPSIPTFSSCIAGVKAGALVQNIRTVTKAVLIAAVVACAPIFISLHGTAVATTDFSPFSSLSFPMFSSSCIAGVKAGALVQNILTVTKALLIAVVVACAPIFIYLHGTSVAATNFSQPLPPLSGYNWSRAGAGLVAAVWAFDGWNCLGYLSEELKNPKKDLPRSLSIGMLTAVGICLAVNSAYFCILPLAAVGKSEVVAVEAVEAVFGPHSGRFIAFLVALNVLGAANATLLCHARFFYAKARDGQLFSFLSAVTTGGAPYASLLATVSPLLLHLYATSPRFTPSLRSSVRSPL
ncbi:unnamed protein product [Closterium sp. NIES-54]